MKIRGVSQCETHAEAGGHDGNHRKEREDEKTWIKPPWRLQMAVRARAMQSEWVIQLAEAKEHQASRTGEAPHY